MAWDGTVMRRWSSATPVPPDNGMDVQFECGHHQVFHLRITEIAERREWPCDECSAPSRARIKAHRDSINFDDVIGKLKAIQ